MSPPAAPPPPNPTWLYRLVHIDCLPTLLARGALHSPHSTPQDGLPYRTIHNVSIQANRHVKAIPCGPAGTIHDYVPFYLGPLSPMLLNLKSGRVDGYTEGQAPLVYLCTTAQVIEEAGAGFVFSDGHGLATFTRWFDSLTELGEVDWGLVGERYWADTPDDNDRKRRKQAEFLVAHSVDWSLIRGIGVQSEAMKLRVEALLAQHPNRAHPPVRVKSGWYY